MSIQVTVMVLSRAGVLSDGLPRERIHFQAHVMEEFQFLKGGGSQFLAGYWPEDNLKVLASKPTRYSNLLQQNQ